MSTAGCRICNFNPRSRKGSDKRQADIAERIDQFQSTLPQGERLQRFGSKHIILSDFNPRSRKGSDSEALKIQQFWDDISIHAPARGATSVGAPDGQSGINFNPRSRKGSDEARKVKLELDEKFQSTLPQGERHQLPQSDFQLMMISIHAPARGATPA